MKLRTALFIVALLATSAVAPVHGQVRGRVTDVRSGEALEGVAVWLAGRTLHLSRSAADGTYVFTDAPPGSYCLRVDSPGYDPANVCVSVSAGASMSVDLPLTARPVVMDPLVVLSRRGIEERSIGLPGDSLSAVLMDQRMTLLTPRTSALAASQLGDLTQMPSPDQSGGNRPHALFVWGSSAERGRVLLDGASLSAPLHLGALLPPIDPEVIAAADVHSGGISPRFDGGTAYIMDFTTRPATGMLRGWGELDFMTARVGLESPLPAAGRVILSARRVNDEVIDGLVSPRFGYAYNDALARTDFDLGDAGNVHLTALATREAISIPRDLDDDRADWTNRAATLVWRRNDAGVQRTAALTISRGVADLPLLSAPGGHLEAALHRYSGLAQRRWDAGPVSWDAGIEVEHLRFRRTARATEDPATGETGHIECTAALPCSHASATLAAVFAEAAFQPAHDITATAGVRAMYDVQAQRAHLLPRASLTWLPSASYAFTLSAGRFSQAYVRETPGDAETALVDVPVAVDVARATHVELSVAHHSPSLSLRAGAFVRRHSRVDPTARARTIPGIDLAAEYTGAPGALSLAWSVSRAARTAGDSVPTVQNLVTAGYHADHGRWQLDLEAAYGAGLPLTSIVLEQPTNESVRQPTSTIQPGSTDIAARSDRSYLRLDISLGAEWHIDRGGSGILIEPYVRVLNALSQRESLFYFQDGGDVEQPPRALARLPAVPMIGVRWHF